MAEVSVNRIQGYLLANAERIVKATGRNKPPGLVEGGSEININPQPVVVKKAVSEREGLDNISDLFNAFTDLNQVDFVTDLPDEVRVKLRPSIRVFKTISTKDGKEIALEVKSSITTGIEDLINPGVVIKDIEIVRLGGNPEEVNTNITVKFRLYATKLGHYFDKQYPAPIKNFFGEIPDDLQKIVDKGISWLDLIKIDLNDQETQDALTAVANADFKETVEQVKGDSPVTLEYDEPEQRIKLELSYGDIGDIEGYDEPTVQRLRQLVASQKEVLFLSLIQNKIEFNDDGTAEIQIDYIASGGTNVLIREHDLLFDPYLYELELRLNDQIDFIEFGDQNVAVLIGTAEQQQELVDFVFEGDGGVLGGPFAGRQAGGAPAPLPPNVNAPADLREAASDPGGDFGSEQVKIRKEAIRRLKDAQAGLLYRGLYGPTMEIATQYKWYYLGGDEYKKEQKQKLLDSISENNFCRVYKHQIKRTDITGKISPRLSRFDGKEARIKNYFYEIIDDVFEARDNNAVPTLEESVNFSDPEFPNSAGVSVSEEQTPDSIVEAQFVFLGDIIEVALEVLASNNRFGTDESFETKFFEVSNRIVNSGQGIRGYERGYARPFYFLPNALSEAAQAAARAAGISPTTSAVVAGQISESAQRTQDKVLQRVYQEYGEILCSEVVYQSPAGFGEIKINLADLPICIAKYKSWLVEKVISKKRNVFYFRDFLSSLLNTLVRPILAEKYSDGETSDREPPELIINRLNVNYPKNDFLDNVPPPPGGASNSRPVKSIKSLIGAQFLSYDSLDAKPLTVISQTPVVEKPVADPRSRRLADRNDNVPHILFGDATNGILQDLSFQRIDMPGLRESRLFEGEKLYNEDNYSGPNIYREKYNASVSLIGTTFFKPGTQFYLDPVPLDLGYAKEIASPARLLGLGGYYLVIRATHQINLAGSATWETSLDTQWQSFGDDSGTRPTEASERGFIARSLRTRLGAAIDLNDPSTRRRYLQEAARIRTAELAPDIPTQAASTGADDGNEVVIGTTESGEEVEVRRRFNSDVRRALGLKD